ncbi:DUF7260 family protein [Halobaculum sp. D14]|uniref:DUF7260 family protein n=1 Tax=unclassified Halobaculum TaxID=2640896 RepID=UPI003EC04B59
MYGSSSGVGRLSTVPVEQRVESICRVTDCGHPELAAALVVLALTAAFLLLAGAVLVRLTDARDAIDVERSRARTERDAFERFRRRLAGLDAAAPTPPSPDPPGGGALAVSGSAAGRSGTGGADLQAARDAYRDTVMATPHYDEEYDESLAENLAAEYNATVAGAVVDGDGLTPQLHATLASGAVRAREERDDLLGSLDAEETDVEEAERTLAPAVEAADRVRDADVDDATYTDLVADYERLEWHERRVESLLADRQDRIHDREAERPHWYDYLFESLQSPYPVLSAATGALDRLESARERLAHAASQR